MVELENSRSGAAPDPRSELRQKRSAFSRCDASGTFFFFHISFHIPPSQARRPCVSVLTVRMCLCFTSLAADLHPRDVDPRATSQEKGRPAG